MYINAHNSRKVAQNIFLMTLKRKNIIDKTDNKAYNLKENNEKKRWLPITIKLTKYSRPANSGSTRSACLPCIRTGRAMWPIFPITESTTLPKVKPGSNAATAISC